MEYETWFWGNVRVVPDEPRSAVDAGPDYSNVELAQNGPPIAHAVARGTSTPECGTAVALLPRGFPWKAPIPNHWQRCPECLRMHPSA